MGKTREAIELLDQKDFRLMGNLKKPCIMEQ